MECINDVTKEKSEGSLQSKVVCFLVSVDTRQTQKVSSVGDELCLSIAAVSDLSVVCSVLAVQQQRQF